MENTNQTNLISLKHYSAILQNIATNQDAIVAQQRLIAEQQQSIFNLQNQMNAVDNPSDVPDINPSDAMINNPSEIEANLVNNNLELSKALENAGIFLNQNAPDINY